MKKQAKKEITPMPNLIHNVMAGLSDTGDPVIENMTQVKTKLGYVGEVFRHGLLEGAAAPMRI